MAACASLDRPAGRLSAHSDPHGDTHLFQSQRPSQKPNSLPWFKLCPDEKPRWVQSPPPTEPQDPVGQGSSWLLPRDRRELHPPHHVCPRADTRTGVCKCGCSAHRDWRGWGWGWGVRPSVPGLTIQMAPFTKLLPVPLPESGSYFQALLPILGWGEALEGLPQLLCGSPQGREPGGAWRVSPSLSSVAGAAWLGPGRDAASHLQAFARAVPVAWGAFPPWCHWLILVPPVFSPLLG